jgi:hypothetical protein
MIKDLEKQLALKGGMDSIFKELQESLRAQESQSIFMTGPRVDPATRRLAEQRRIIAWIDGNVNKNS